jgi:hypothetical protein
MSKIKNFACLIYPESSIIDWQESISSFGVPYYYILHDKDTKKPHYHVLFTPVNAISTNTAQKIINSIGGANGKYERVASKRGYMRYLTHMDNPEKYQYDPREIFTGCGAKYKLEMVVTPEEALDSEYDTIQDMIEYIDANNLFLYCDFVKHCVTYRRDWFKVLCSPRGRVIDKYIKSLYWAHYHTLN